MRLLRHHRPSAPAIALACIALAALPSLAAAQSCGGGELGLPSGFSMLRVDGFAVKNIGTEIASGQRVTVKLDQQREPGCRAWAVLSANLATGETYAVSVAGLGAPVIGWYIDKPYDASARTFVAARQAAYDQRTWQIEGKRDGRWAIVIAGEASDLGKEVTVCLDCSLGTTTMSGTPRSSTAGLMIQPVLVGSRESASGSRETGSGSGYGIRVGLGFGQRLVVDGEYTTQILDEGSGSASEIGLYDLTGTDVGARLYVTGAASAFRPYLRGAYGLREREDPDGSTVSGVERYKGRALTAAVGAHFFLGRAFAFDLEGGWSRATFDQARVDGDWRDLSRDFETKELRVTFGATLNFTAWMER